MSYAEIRDLARFAGETYAYSTIGNITSKQGATYTNGSEWQ